MKIVSLHDGWETVANEIGLHWLVGGAEPHPNIVRIYGALVHDDFALILQEFVEGTTLRNLLRGEKWLTQYEAMNFYQQMASAVCLYAFKGSVSSRSKACEYDGRFQKQPQNNRFWICDTRYYARR